MKTISYTKIAYSGLRGNVWYIGQFKCVINKILLCHLNMGLPKNQNHYIYQKKSRGVDIEYIFFNFNVINFGYTTDFESTHENLL